MHMPCLARSPLHPMREDMPDRHAPPTSAAAWQSSWGGSMTERSIEARGLLLVVPVDSRATPGHPS